MRERSRISMSRQIIRRRILTNGVMTGTTTLRSEPFSLRSPATLQLSWPTAGAPTGAWRVLVSNSWCGRPGIKTVAQAITDGEFQPLNGAVATAISAGPSDTIEITEDGTPYEYAVLEYVNATGTGVLQVDFAGVGLG